MNKILLLITLMLINVTSTLAERAINLPEELLQIAEKRKCNQIVDFYVGKYGPVKPPYTYGVAKGNKSDSAAFWCQRKRGRDNEFVLMFMLRDKKDGAKYAGEIEWINNPDGLEPMPCKKKELSNSKKINQSGLPLNKGFEGCGVVSTDGELFETFYMKNGDWWVQQLH